VVSGVTVARGTDPTAVCAGLRPPFAVKVIAPVSHKARVGGVSLGVCCVEDLTEVIASVESAVAAAGVPDAAIEGCLVEEMVFGREVLLGLNRDPIFGPYIVVALGGAMTEIASRSSTRLLPLAAGEAERLLSAIGISGHEAAAASIRTLCEAFVDGALAAHETVEVNPLIISAAEFRARHDGRTAAVGAPLSLKAISPGDVPETPSDLPGTSNGGGQHCDLTL
jgi:succinyl-CoA synthetase beta subunit